MKNIVLSLSTLLYFGVSYAQPMTLTLGVEATELADRLQGEGVTILNPELYCLSVAQGLYADDVGILGIGEGIMLSTANLSELFYDNTEFPVEPIWSSAFFWDPHLIDTFYHRPLLDSWGIVCSSPRSSCALTMDVVPQHDVLAFDYVLADGLLESNVPEVGEGGSFPVNWVVPLGDSTGPCACYPNTAFITAMISGGSLGDTVNIAVFPESRNNPVNRYTLRMTEELLGDVCNFDAEVFWDGGPYLDYCRYNEEGGSIEVPQMRMRGMTIPMEASVSLNPCDTYRLMLSASHILQSGGYAGLHDQIVYFISNLHSTGDSCGATGIEDLKHTLGLSINPNPFSDQLRLSISHEYTNRALGISVSDITGRTLLKADGNATSLNKKLDGLAAGLNPGMYFMSVQDKESVLRQVFKVVKE